MGKMLLICEKPSQARNWATALGGMSGTYNGQDYVISHALGHLFEQKDPHEMVPKDKEAVYKAWTVSGMPWDETDFTWKMKKRTGVADVCRQLQAAAKGCDIIAFAGDTDPSGEGDVITYEAICGLGLNARKYVRLSFGDEAPATLQKAFENPEPIPDIHKHPPVLKALFRSHWDFIGGLQWTRMATVLAGQRGKVLRNGRLKSACIVLVGDQLEAVNNYVRKPFFQNRFKDENEVVYTNPDEPTFDAEEQVPQTYHASAVVCDSKTMKKTAPPKLIDLATLSARLAPRGISAKQALATYQAMYEAQVVSYPRTEDKCITEEQFKDLLPKVDAIARVVGVDPKLVSHRVPRKTHIKDGMAHGANRPGPNVPSSLSDLDGKFGKGAAMIYEMLAKNYLAMMCPDYEYEQQKGHVKDYPKFVGSSNVPKVMGWKAVYDADEGDDEGSDKGLGTKAEPFVYEGANPKPQNPTQRWLMKQLEKRDIGTGATRTSTYADITKKSEKNQIFEDKKGRITFADCGEMSYLMLKGTHIADLDITKHVQDEMAEVAKGKKTESQCLHEIQSWVRDDIVTMTANADAMRKKLGIKTSDQYTAEKVSGTFKGQEVSFKPSFSGHDFTEAEIGKLLAGETIEIEAKRRDGSTYTVKGALGEGEYNGRKYFGFQPQFESREKDPSKFYGTFQGRGKNKGKEVGFKREWGGHKFTDAECEALLAGKEVSFEAMSKSGNPYTAKGKLAQQTYKGRKFWGFKPDFGKK